MVKTLVPVLFDLNIGKFYWRLQRFDVWIEKGARCPRRDRYDQIGLPNDRRKYNKIGHRERDASLDLLCRHDVLNNYIVARTGRSNQHMRDLAEQPGSK